MLLVTLEGFEKTCDELLQKVHSRLKCHVLPWPMSTSTSAQTSASDEISACFAGLLTRLRCLQRLGDAETVCGAHWNHMPNIMDAPERDILHEVVLAVARAMTRALGVVVARHVVIVVHSNIHEVFERMIEAMESRDVVLSDIEGLGAYYDAIARGQVVPSVFPYRVESIVAPPFMNDNYVDVAMKANEITHILATITD